MVRIGHWFKPWKTIELELGSALAPEFQEIHPPQTHVRTRQSARAFVAETLSKILEVNALRDLAPIGKQWEMGIDDLGRVGPVTFLYKFSPNL